MPKSSTLVIRLTPEDRVLFENAAGAQPVSAWLRDVGMREIGNRSGIAQALRDIDWGQVVLNGGPPCFHVEDGRFCLRAERWDGHRAVGFHGYVSMERLMEGR